MERWEREYDNWKTSTPWDNDKEVGHCAECDGEIYEGEDIFKVEDDMVHEECFHDYAMRVLDVVRTEAEKEEHEEEW